MYKSMLVAVVLLYLAACGEKPTEYTTATPTESITEPAAITPEVTATSSPNFKQDFELNGIHFLVETHNEGTTTFLRITPSGLSEVNHVINYEIDGNVSAAEIADINADGSPEIYVWITAPGPENKITPIAYSANNKKSLSDIYFSPISEDTVNGKGYMGHDEFAVLENSIVHRFPIYETVDNNAIPSGKIRQLEYKLIPGTNSWLMKLNSVQEF